MVATAILAKSGNQYSQGCCQHFNVRTSHIHFLVLATLPVQRPCYHLPLNLCSCFGEATEVVNAEVTYRILQLGALQFCSVLNPSLK